MQRKIAVIGGTGDQGLGLAMRLTAAGEHLIIGSRQKARAEEAVAKIKSQLGAALSIEGMENPQAVENASIIFLTVPFTAQVATLKSIKNKFKENDTLIDVTVPLAAEIGGRATRTLGVWQGSAAEQAAELLPKHVHMASAFHNVSAGALQAVGKPVDCDVIVCGNDDPAKQLVADLIGKIEGARYINGGALENSRIVEQLTALLIAINMNYKIHTAGIRITGIP